MDIMGTGVGKLQPVLSKVMVGLYGELLDVG